MQGRQEVESRKVKGSLLTILVLASTASSLARISPLFTTSKDLLGSSVDFCHTLSTSPKLVDWVQPESGLGKDGVRKYRM